MLLHKPTDGALDSLEDEQVLWIREKAKEVTSIYYDGIRQMVNHMDAQEFNQEELVAIWSLLNSKIRTAYKDEKEFREANK